MGLGISAFDGLRLAGYRVSLRQRWGDSGPRMPPTVTHLGLIAAPSGTVYLGFNYDRKQERVEFVTASFAFARD